MEKTKIRSGKNGYLQEIFSSFQGEGSLMGRRQVFVRMAGCPMQCIYCDTPRYPYPEFCQIQRSPRAQVFKLVKNPMSVNAVIRELERLITPDIHSMAITGGEPLIQFEFLKCLIQELNQRGFKIYLESAGIDSSKFREIVDMITYASLDVKLPDHGASDDWSKLISNEIECIRASVEHGVHTIAKLVILDSVDSSVFEHICSLLNGLELDLVIQPVTPMGGIRPPHPSKLFELSEIAARYLDPSRIMILPQIHKILGVR